MADYLGINSYTYQQTVTSVSFQNDNAGVSRDFKDVLSDRIEDEEKSDEQLVDLGMGFVLTPGFGHGMTAAQVISPDSDDVVIRVKVSGTSEKYYEVNLSEVDPKNATAIEMFAYCQYADANGTGNSKAHFGSWNALKQTISPANGMEFDSLDDVVNKKIDWTKKVSESNVSFVNENTGEVMTVEDVLKMLLETFQSLNHTDEEDDWRNMSDDEWEKLIAKIDNDIEAMREYLDEMAKEAEQKQMIEAAVETQLV